MKQLERRGTDSPGPVCGQKSQVQVMENKQGLQELDSLLGETT